MVTRKRDRTPPEPPQSLSAVAQEVWNEIVASNDLAGTVDRAALEAFCTLMARLREARARVDAEGMVVKDGRGRAVPHPALAVERQIAEQIRAWGDRFEPLVKPARKRGYMADATGSTIANAAHLKDKKEFAGPVAMLKTLAWLIDEAQRSSMDDLQRASTTTIPMYLKACEALQVTPVSIPEKSKGGGGGKLSHLRSVRQGTQAAVGT